MPDRVAVVALSGGVDSAFAALKLISKGYRVFGLFMDIGLGRHHADEAKRVAFTLGIPLHVVRLREPFEELVVDYFVREYLAGRTPNPCAVCNRRVKFGLLKEEAGLWGAELFATGHYACLKDGVLSRARDTAKDQSYFLCLVESRSLDGVEFPLCGEKKSHVRSRMAELGINSAESQEVCFLRGTDYRRFLLSRVGERPGRLVDSSGRFLGEHRGFFLFTIGQRRGLGVSLGRPMYVVKIIPEENTVVLGPEEELYSKSMEVEDLNWYENRRAPFWGWVKIRHQHTPARALVYPDGRVEFERPQRAVTPGQVACIYDDTGKVIAGGIIRCAM